MVDLRDLPPDLQQRYGYRPTSRWLTVLGIAVVVVVLLAGALVAWDKANPDVRWKLVTWSAPADDHTVVTWELIRDGNDPVTCVIRVTDANLHDVAYATVTIPPGADHEQPTYDVRTRTSGRVVEVLGCAANGTPTVPAPEFPPGTSNPPQPWTP